MDMDRILGVITLKAPVYRQIADDANATTPAAIITAVVALISGFFGGAVAIDQTLQTSSFNVTGGVILAIITVIFALIGWFISAWVLAFVSRWFGGKTNTMEMLRVTGFVNIFGLVSILSILALIAPALGCIVGIIGFVAAILRLIGYIIGVREAAEFSTGNAIIAAIIAAIINFLIVVVAVGAVAAIFGVGAAVLGGVPQ
jgi:hypothetical protein